MSKLIIISAPSGAGKTTIVREIMKDDSLKLMFSVSATSRKPRENEQNGIDYYFISPEEFKQKIQNNEFVEWEEVYTNQFYGTLKSEVERIWKMNKNVIFDVDVKGGINIKRKYPKQALSIFIMPPSIEELRNRLVKRGTETAESIEKRISKAEFEISQSKEFDKIVVNDDLKEAIQHTKSLITDFLKE